MADISSDDERYDSDEFDGYCGTENLIDDFNGSNEMPLVYPDLDLGSSFSAVYQELKRHDGKELKKLEFKYLSVLKTQEENATVGNK